MAQAETEQENRADIYQLELQPKTVGSHIGAHVEVQYKWCDRHMIAYSVRPPPAKKSRKYGECPMCWRERNPRRKRR